MYYIDLKHSKITSPKLSSIGRIIANQDAVAAKEPIIEKVSMVKIYF